MLHCTDGIGMQGLVDLLCALPVDLKSGASDPHSARPSADSSCTDQGCLHRPIIMAHMQVLASTIVGAFVCSLHFRAVTFTAYRSPRNLQISQLKLNHLLGSPKQRNRENMFDDIICGHSVYQPASCEKTRTDASGNCPPTRQMLDCNKPSAHICRCLATPEPKPLPGQLC